MIHLIATGFSLAIGYAAFELAVMAGLAAINGFFLLCGAVFSTKPKTAKLIPLSRTQRSDGFRN